MELRIAMKWGEISSFFLFAEAMLTNLRRQEQT
jgi:hypothetical protein